MRKFTGLLFTIGVCAGVISVSPSFRDPVKVKAVASETNNTYYINNVSDFLAISNDPSGRYILMNDVDLSGVETSSVPINKMLLKKRYKQRLIKRQNNT